MLFELLEILHDWDEVIVSDDLASNDVFKVGAAG